MATDPKQPAPTADDGPADEIRAGETRAVERAAAIAPAGADDAAADPSAEPDQCLNCGTPLQGMFCHACGQKGVDLRKPFLTFVTEFLDAALNWDGRFAKTLFYLTLSPGRMTRNYVEGRRRRYVPPVRLFAVVSVAFFTVATFSDVVILNIALVETERSKSGAEETRDAPADEAGDAPAATVGQDPASQSTDAPDPDCKQRFQMFATGATAIDHDRVCLLDFQSHLRADLAEAVGFNRRVMGGFATFVEDPRMLNNAFNNWLPRALVLLMPLMAVMLRMVHWRRGQYLFNHLVFSLHYHTFIFLMFITLFAVVPAFGAMAGAFLFFGSPALYLFVAMKRFYRQGWFRTIIKFLFVGTLHMGALHTVLIVVLILGFARF